MRRTSAPRVRTTKPVTSLVDVPAVAVTESVPGTVTAGGTATEPLPDPGTTDAVQAPAPPPASVSVTVWVADARAARRPNERPVGCAKSIGLSARTRVAIPPPSRSGSAPLPDAGRAASPVSVREAFTCATVHVGWRSRSRAAAPAMWGAAMLVPLRTPNDPGRDERIWTPGAATSGFIASEIGVGPADEKSATTPFELTAATVIAPAAFPGEETEP